MLRPRASERWAFVLAVVVLVFAAACDEPTPRLGLQFTDEGILRILYDPCDPETKVRSVRLTDDETGRVIWEIQGSGAVVHRFTVGETPLGFEEVSAYSANLPDARLRIRVRSEAATNSETFKQTEVRSDDVLVPRLGYLSEQEFVDRDTCD